MQVIKNKRVIEISKDLLIQEYLINKKTIKTISDILGCSFTKVRVTLVKYDIPRRKPNYLRTSGQLKNISKSITLYNKQNRDKVLSNLNKARKSPIKAKLQSEYMKRRWQNPEFRDSMIPFLKDHLKNNPKIIRNNLIKGKNHHRYGKPSSHGKGAYYKNIWMRSQYEIKYVEYLNSKNIKWQYEPRAFELVLNSKETTYTPDFYLPETDEYVEIKGWWRDDAELKYQNFLNKYPEIKIKVLLKKDLQELGII